MTQPPPDDTAPDLAAPIDAGPRKDPTAAERARQKRLRRVYGRGVAGDVQFTAGILAALIIDYRTLDAERVLGFKLSPATPRSDVEDMAGLLLRQGLPRSVREEVGRAISEYLALTLIRPKKMTHRDAHGGPGAAISPLVLNDAHGESR